ncbi:MAG: hypothetical protein PQ275_24490 [Elizabethkingia anophelis]|nr:MAG: hypothetical protein PQ275_24490 [Elizabethkingia anophelis]
MKIFNTMKGIFKNYNKYNEISSAFSRNEEDNICPIDYLDHVILINISKLNEISPMYGLDDYMKLKFHLDKLKLRLNSQREKDFISSITDIFKLSINELVKRDAANFLEENLKNCTNLDSIIDDWYKRIEQY